MDFLKKSVLPVVIKSLRNGWIFRLIGVVVFIVILCQINLNELLRTIKQIDPFWLLFSLVMQGIALLIATFRWKVVMEFLNICVPYGKSVIHQLIGTGMALVTPGQLGEFVKVLYHRNLGFPVPESALSVILDRLYDLLMLFFFGFVSLAILFGLSPELITGLIVAGSILGLLIMYYLLNKEKAINWFAIVITKICPKPYKETIGRDFHRLIGYIGQLKPTFFLACLLLSFGNYAFLTLRFYVLALSVQMDVSFWYVALAVPLIRLVGLLPISISGIGTRDALLIYLFYNVGIPAEKSLALSLLGLITILFQALVGVLCWWRYPPKISEPIISPIDAPGVLGVDPPDEHTDG